jgi:hypothetical protein
MKQLSGTNIFVNYNLFTDEERQKSEDLALRAFQREVATNRALRQTIEAERIEATEKYGGYSEWRTDVAVANAKKRDALLEEIKLTKATKEGAAYEARVLEVLEAIRGNALGKIVLGHMDAKHRVWIVPTTEENGEACDCLASTSPGVIARESGGGVRVRFTPGDHEIPDGFYSNEDVLFHELVHAYRATNYSTADHWWAPLSEYRTQEEVLAVQVTNVYRSARGYSNFYRSLSNTTLLTKERLYLQLAVDRPVFDTMRLFLEEDKLAKRLAKLTAPACNPWRDAAMIQKKRETLIDL